MQLHANRNHRQRRVLANDDPVGFGRIVNVLSKRVPEPDSSDWPERKLAVRWGDPVITANHMTKAYRIAGNQGISTMSSHFEPISDMSGFDTLSYICLRGVAVLVCVQ